MKQALWKNIFREIKKTFGRFLSILLMIAVGVMIYVGLKVTGPFLGDVAKQFLTETNAAHMEVTSNYQLDSKDIELLEKVSGVDTLELGYHKEFAIQSSHIPIRLMSKTNHLSLVKVTEGRLPKNNREILLDTSMKDAGYRTGDVIVFQKDDKNSLSHYQFKIVGFGNHPSYLQITNRGFSTIGTGKIKGFGVIQKEVFQLEDYQTAMFQFQDMKGVDLLSKQYVALSNQHRQEIENLLTKNAPKKLTRIHQLIEDEVANGDQKIRDAKQAISDAKKKLADGNRELSDGFSTYETNKHRFETEIKNAEKQLQDAQKKLSDGKQSLKNSEALLRRSQERYDQGAFEIKGRQDELAAQEKILQDGNRQLKDAQKKLTEERYRLEQALLEIEKNEQEYHQGLAYYQAEQQKLDMAYREYEKRWNDFQQRLPALIEQKNELNTEIQKKQDSLAVLLKEREEKSAEISNKKAQQEDLRKQIADWQRDAELLQALAQVNALQSEIAALQAQMEHAPDNEKVAIQQQINQKKQELTAAQEKYQARNAYVDTQVQALHAQISAIQQEIDAMILPDTDPLEQDIATLTQKRDQIDQTIATTSTALEKAKVQLDTGKNALSQTKQQLDAAYQKIRDGKAKISHGLVQVQLATENLARKEKELSDGFSRLSGGKTLLEQALEKLSVSKRQLDLGYREFAEGKAQIEIAEDKYFSGIRALEQNRSSGISQLQDAYRQLSDAQKELNDKQKEFDDALPDSKKEIADAKKELKKARDQKDILVDPIYRVIPLEESVGIYEFFDITGRLSIISNIFPLFFFLIAILVSMTTLTRMVDESREQMGMLKALGYGKGDIILKFVVYAFSASLLGGILGVVFGHTIIGIQIAGAYTGDFIFEIRKIDFHAYYSLIGILIGVISTVTVSLLVAYRTLQKQPAALIRKKAPSQGSRIFLERIKPIWNRLSFIHKVTARNIFRYKKRMLMTIFGVAGCVGLLIMGIGIQDSLSGILDHQFGNILKYHYIIVSEEKLDRDAYLKYQTYLKSSEVKHYFPLQLKSAYISLPQKKDECITILATDDKKNFDTVVSLRDRKTQKPLSLTDDGIIITETTANVFDIQKGDFLTFHDAYFQPYRVKVTGVTENYTGHYMYMTDTMYERIFQTPFQKNADLVHASEKHAKDIKEKLLDNDTVVSLIEVSRLKDTLQQSLDSLNMLVLVIIICACILAFVVLYNLNNINISERKLELSTIKVLGFYNQEVTAYIYRETILLSLIGILLGFGVGKMMHGIIITRLIPDIIMLNPSLKMTNFILSSAITSIFTVIVMMILHYKLRKINMIEALKED